jgi:geranylgeranyl diphosphate synthase type I
MVLRASQLLDQATLEMIEGQYLDLKFEHQLEISVQDYLKMVERKTGALLGAALEIGALLASADERVIALFRNCGRKFGLCFQIGDDILGIWGDKSQTGKSIGNDILRRKKSLPIVCAVHGPRGAELRSIYRRAALDEARLPLIMEILEETGAREGAEALAEGYCSQALAELEGVKLPPWARGELEELTRFLLTRKH